MTSDIFERERKSSAPDPLVKLSRMLASISRRYPHTRLTSTVGDFGVSLGDNRSLHVRCSGQWSDAELRDWLALFATWLVADPAGLRERGIRLDGLSAEAMLRSERLSGRHNSND